MNNHTATTSIYGVYDDAYIPVDDDSRAILRRRRWMKYAVVSAILVLAAVLASSSSRNTQAYSYPAPADAQTDHIFAGLLADEQAFYFPMVSQHHKRRFLKGGNGVDWSYDWTANAKDGAAIGEYYRGKGLAMADYYRSKFDPTYKAPDADATKETDASTWTYDWKADMGRGVALGKHYKAIGGAINAHYREAFDPTYVPAAKTSADEGAHRMLKSKEKKMKDRTKKELAMDMGAGGGWYDWQADADRGMAIGMHYKQMGETIADHYNQEFNPMYDDVNKKADADKNWSTMWQDYQQRGQEIANYYKGKGAAIDKFYQGKYGATNNDSVASTSAAANANAAVAGSPQEATSVWGLDWEKDKNAAMDIHNDMMKKGLAIGEYYRAKYDPTYGAVAPDDEGSASSANLDPQNPDLDFPPWGVDPEADRQHGIAIGQYWKEKGTDMGLDYKKRGTELGQYYANKYRTMFDPTYIADP
ncbi:MAG: hypothetical protein SGARI_000800 [Bacillariaceae sp.]